MKSSVPEKPLATHFSDTAAAFSGKFTPCPRGSGPFRLKPHGAWLRASGCGRACMVLTDNPRWANDRRKSVAVVWSKGGNSFLFLLPQS